MNQKIQSAKHVQADLLEMRAQGPNVDQQLANSEFKGAVNMHATEPDEMKFGGGTARGRLAVILLAIVVVTYIVVSKLS